MDVTLGQMFDVHDTAALFTGLLVTRSTREVAHLRSFVSERRGTLIPNRRDVNVDFETKKRFVDLRHGIIRRDAF